MDADFLRVLLHDLQGPVARMRMLSELVDRRCKTLDEETRTLVGHIGVSAATAGAILDALQRYADAAGLAYQPQRFELGMAAADAGRRVESRLAKAGGTLECSE